MPEFTQDWFSHNIPGLQAVMNLLPQKRTFLEVGAFEGRSTLWFYEQLEHHPESTLISIDTWGGSEEHVGINFADVRRRYQENTDGLLGHTTVVGTSQDFVRYEPIREFDFIYIDGSHQAPDVLADACLLWPYLGKGGIMVFDDYLWNINNQPTHAPKMAVDAFIACYYERLEIVLGGYQMAVRKV